MRAKNMVPWSYAWGTGECDDRWGEMPLPNINEPRWMRELHLAHRLGSIWNLNRFFFHRGWNQ